MKIFEIQNQTAVPTLEILLISPFREIWERDITMHKHGAIREFTYIEFMCSPKKTNPFFGYVNEDERSNKIIERVFQERNWKPDELIDDAIDVYEEFLKKASPALSYLNDAMLAVGTLQEFFRTVDLTERNMKGALLYKPRDITSALGDSEKVIKQLNVLRDKVEQELFEAGKTMNNRTISKFEE